MVDSSCVLFCSWSTLTVFLHNHSKKKKTSTNHMRIVEFFVFLIEKRKIDNSYAFLEKIILAFETEWVQQQRKCFSQKHGVKMLILQAGGWAKNLTVFGMLFRTWLFVLHFYRVERIGLAVTFTLDKEIFFMCPTFSRPHFQRYPWTGKYGLFK